MTTEYHIGYAVSSDGVAVSIGISFELSAAYDILVDDGYPPDKAAEILATAEREHAAGRMSKNVEEFARHMVKLRKAMRG